MGVDSSPGQSGACFFAREQAGEHSIILLDGWGHVLPGYSAPRPLVPLQDPQPLWVVDQKEEWTCAYDSIFF
jgi:hypothetical protein